MSDAAKALEAGDLLGALLRYLLIAEQGSERAAASSAFMLQRGLGYSGPGSLDLAARMFERAAKQVCSRCGR